MPEQLLKSGQVRESLAKMTQVVRANPANAEYRLFLFQAHCLLESWDRGLTQLSVAADLDDEAKKVALTYQSAALAEIFRADVFRGKRSPLIMGEPDTWLACLIEALKATGRGSTREAAELGVRAFDEAPTTSGSITLEGREPVRFEWLADADSRLGPVFEGIIGGKYYWIPVHRVRRIFFESPKTIRDLIWAPALIEFSNATPAQAFVPVRYPGSGAAEDEAMALARATDWQELGADRYVGLGQRMLATDVDDFPLLDVREIAFDVEVEAPGAEAEGSTQ